MRKIDKLLLAGETRVWRTYTGGVHIDSWRGRELSQNSEFPEDWIASTVCAKNPTRDQPQEGLSRVLNLEHQPLLRDVLHQDPEKWLGKRHAEKFGGQPGMLIKLIDAGERLTIQAHPDKAYAKSVLSSDYGKTEAWYFLDCAPDACIYLGFRPNITREHWKKVFDEQDIPEMLACLHRIPVKAGDSFVIEGGVPHAIGKGCFLIEIQEPTDFTMRTERITPNGRVIDDMQCHQGVGFEKMFDCFHYEGLPLEEVLNRWKVQPIEETLEGAVRHSLIDARYTKMFTMRHLAVSGSCCLSPESQARVFAVISGCGTITADHCDPISLSAGVYIFAAAGQECIQLSGSELEIIECLPPNTI